MDRVPDRKKLRRDYLRKKRLISVGLGTGFTASAMLAIWGILSVRRAVTTYPGSLLHDPLALIAVCFMALVWLCCSGIFGYATVRIRKVVPELAYVPPVTTENLPAEEVLVRGSEEPPVAQREVLLRASTGVDTPKEQLLRIASEDDNG